MELQLIFDFMNLTISMQKRYLPLLLLGLSILIQCFSSNAQVCPTNPTTKKMGTSGTGHSMLNSNSNSLYYDAESGMLVMIYRNNPSLNGGSDGLFRISYSTNYGATWTTEIGPLNIGNTAAAEGSHPMLTVFNKTGLNIPDSSRIVYLGTTRNILGATWNGINTGIYQIGSGYSSSSYDALTGNFPGQAASLCKGKPGTFFALELEDQTNGGSKAGLQVLKGTWVDTLHDVIWSKDTMLIPDYDSLFNNRQYVEGYDMAFDPTGRYGWISMITDVKGSTDEVYSLVFYNSTDSGKTWSGPWIADLNTLAPTGTGVNVSAAKEVDLAVDTFGNPHALVDVVDALASSPYQFNANYRGHYMYDVTFNGQNWAAMVIDTLKSFEGSYTSGTPWVHGTRPQMSRSATGSVLVYSWFDSDTTENLHPRLRARGFNAVSGCWTSVHDFLDCSNQSQDTFHLSTASPILIENNGIWQLPVVLMKMGRSGVISDTSVLEFLNNASFSASDFSESRAIIQSNSSVYKLCKSKDLILTAFPSHQKYLWSNGDTTTSIKVTQSGWVSLEVTTSCGVSKDSVYIESSDLAVSIGASRKRLCPNDSIQLNANLSGTLLWSTGDTVSSIYVKSAGWYTLSISDSCGSGKDSIEILPSGSQKLSFVSGKLSGCPGDTAVLYAGPNHNNYQWSNGAQTATIYATQPGKYYCTVEDSTGCLLKTDTIQVDRVAFPTINLSSSNAGICSSDSTLLYTSKHQGPYRYAWFRNGSLLAGKSDSSIWVADTGTYVLVLADTVSKCAIQESIVMKSYPSPSANVVVTGSTLLCKGDSVMLEVNQNNGATFQWFNNGNIINGAKDSTYFAKTNGVYTVKVTTSAGCSRMSNGVSVASDTLPADTISMNKPAACEGDTVTLSAQFNSNWTYQWYDIGGAISNATKHTYPVTMSGDYFVVIKTAAGCETTTKILSLNFTFPPFATIINPNNTDICLGDSVLIEAVTQNGVTYQWRKNGVNINGATDTLYWAFGQGDYDVVMTNVAGCSGVSNLVSITEKTSPNPRIRSNAGFVLCPQDTIILDVLSNGTYNTIEWFKDGSPFGSGGVAQQITQAGLYTVKVNNTNGCSGTSKGALVLSIPNPTPTITRNGNVLTASQAFTYQWFLNGVALPGANNQTHNMTQAGTYSVEVTDTNGCTGKSTPLAVNLSAKAIAQQGPILNVYPNPFQNSILIELHKELKSGSYLVVSDLAGKIVHQTPLTGQAGHKEVVILQDIKSGVYLLRIMGSHHEEMETIRLMKQ